MMIYAVQNKSKIKNKNVQKYAEIRQKYAKICIDPTNIDLKKTLCKNMLKICQICKICEHKFKCKICRNSHS